MDRRKSAVRDDIIDRELERFAANLEDMANNIRLPRHIDQCAHCEKLFNDYSITLDRAKSLRDEMIAHLKKTGESDDEVLK